MFGLVSQSKYDAAVNRAELAEARVAEFEKQVEAQTAINLKAYQKKVDAKKAARTKKIEVKDGNDTAGSDPTCDIDPKNVTAVDNTLVAVSTPANTADRVAQVKELRKTQSTKEVAAALGISETTVRRDLKK